MKHKNQTNPVIALTTAVLLTAGALFPTSVNAQDGCSYGSNCDGYGGGYSEPSSQSAYDQVSGAINGIYGAAKTAADTYAVGAVYYQNEAIPYTNDYSNTYQTYEGTYYYPGYDQSTNYDPYYGSYGYTGGYGYDQSGYPYNNYYGQ